MFLGLCSGKGRKTASDEYTSIAPEARKQGSPNGSPKAAVPAKGINPSAASQATDEKILNGLFPGIILKEHQTMIEQNTEFSFFRYQLVSDDVELAKSKLSSLREKKKVILLKFNNGLVESVLLHSDLLDNMNRNQVEYCGRFIKGIDGNDYILTSKPKLIPINSETHDSLLLETQNQI